MLPVCSTTARSCRRPTSRLPATPPAHRRVRSRLRIGNVELSLTLGVDFGLRTHKHNSGPGRVLAHVHERLSTIRACRSFRLVGHKSSTCFRLSRSRSRRSVGNPQRARPPPALVSRPAREGGRDDGVGPKANGRSAPTADSPRPCRFGREHPRRRRWRSAGACSAAVAATGARFEASAARVLCDGVNSMSSGPRRRHGTTRSPISIASLKSSTRSWPSVCSVIGAGWPVRRWDLLGKGTTLLSRGRPISDESISMPPLHHPALATRGIVLLIDVDDRPGPALSNAGRMVHAVDDGTPELQPTAQTARSSIRLANGSNASCSMAEPGRVRFDSRPTVSVNLEGPSWSSTMAEGGDDVVKADGAARVRASLGERAIAGRAARPQPWN